MSIEIELIDRLLADCRKPEDIIGKNGLLKRLTKTIVERALSSEMSEHLGYEKNDPAGAGSGNSRNGTSQKTLKGEFGKVEIEVPRDRKATFECNGSRSSPASFSRCSPVRSSHSSLTV